MNDIPNENLVVKFNDAGTGATWSISDIDLIPGPNTLAITAIDESGNYVTTERIVTRVVSGPITIQTAGHGSVTNGFTGSNLEFGKSYKLTAVPDPGWIFVGWEEDVSGNDPKLTFVMQENMVVRARFVANPFPQASGVYNGLVRPGLFDQNTTGFFTLTSTSTGAFSGKLNLGAATMSFTGHFDLTGLAHLTIQRKGKPLLTMDLQVDFTGSNQVTGTISDGTFTSNIVADHSVFDGRNATSPDAGSYTALLRPVSGLTTASGYGFATIVVGANGVARFAGSLADGTAVTLSATISKDGVLPIYLLLYKNLGALSGTVAFSEQGKNDASGSLDWFRPAAGAKPGINVSVDLVAAIYQNTAPVLVLANGALKISGPALGPLTRSITIGNDNKVIVTPGSPDLKLSVKITPATGLFTGKFTPPNAPARSFSGVVQQGEGIGAGFFTGPNDSGAVTFGEK